MQRFWWVIALVACDDGGNDPAAQVQLVDAAIAADAALAEDRGAAMDAAMDAALAPDAALDAAVSVDAAPMRAEPVPAAPIPAYSGGACPILEAGRNAFEVAGLERTVDVFLPPAPEGAPLLFLWHPLGSNASQIGRFFGASDIAAEQGWIVVVPESRRLQTEWAFVGDPAADLAVFDDLLACLDAQFGVDAQRVYTSGFSAGALWSSYLIMHRGEHLAAALVLSGGVTAFTPHRSSPFALPVLLTWGGPNDQYGGVINFQETTGIFRDRLREDGHPVVTCEHVGGHVPPPGVADWGIAWLAGHTERRAAHAFSDDAPYPDTCVVVE